MDSSSAFSKCGRLSFNEFKYQTYFASKINHLVTYFYRDVISDLDITCVVERIRLEDERNDVSLSLLSDYAHYCNLTNKKKQERQRKQQGLFNPYRYSTTSMR